MQPYSAEVTRLTHPNNVSRKPENHIHRQLWFDDPKRPLKRLYLRL